MKLAIANDHAGTKLKNVLVEALSSAHEWMNLGTDAEDSVDYPDYVHPLAQKVAAGEVDLGVLICGSGNGVCMTANKHQEIRAALCWNVEIASLARQHNNANVICIPARFLSESEALEVLKSFLNATFEGGRHERRVSKISCQ